MCAAFERQPPLRLRGSGDIERQFAHNLSVKPGTVFLSHTGWYHKCGTAPFDYIRHYPGLDGDAAHWLADQGIVCVGADAPSVDSFYEIATRLVQPVHMMCRVALTD